MGVKRPSGPAPALGKPEAETDEYWLRRGAKSRRAAEVSGVVALSFQRYSTQPFPANGRLPEMMKVLPSYQPRRRRSGSSNDSRNRRGDVFISWLLPIASSAETMATTWGAFGSECMSEPLPTLLHRPGVGKGEAGP